MLAVEKDGAQTSILLFLNLPWILSQKKATDKIILHHNKWEELYFFSLDGCPFLLKYCQQTVPKQRHMYYSVINVNILKGLSVEFGRSILNPLWSLSLGQTSHTLAWFHISCGSYLNICGTKMLCPKKTINKMKRQSKEWEKILKTSIQ